MTEPGTSAERTRRGASITPDPTFAPPVLDSRRGAVATLTLNRPERLNALNGALGQALVEALHSVAEDAAVRAVVLTGAGRGFCAGGDLDLLRRAREREDVTEVEALLKMGKQMILAIATMHKPVLAAVNGPAAGAGANLALACTARIASEAASFTQSFAKIGLFPDFGATYFLPRLVGRALAAELLLTAATLSAAEALGIGLVSHVVSPDRFEQETALLADRLAAAPPIVARGIKQTLCVDDRAQLEKALDEEIRWQKTCFRSDDCREGLQAYLEKRPPRFHGS
jgi:2-(1,2-epoxy-1,2-dihydrophenyl)acetyl-CoA isomerase